MAEPRLPPDSSGPIVAPRGASAANASHPDTRLDEAYHIYEANPAPWWVGVLWLTFFLFAVVYLIRSMT